MPVDQKPDSDAILRELTHLKNEAWLGQSRSWWPNYLFHFSDITNIAKILIKGKLLSRSILESSGEFKDIASPDVIDGTASQWKDYVRLYFKPRAPTLYKNEGMRPSNLLALGGAHCPVPVLLLFDSSMVLTRQDSLFSEGNLGVSGYVAVGNDARFFSQLPFDKVYHDSSLYGLSDNEKRNIVFHRHAEVIVPNEMDLLALKHIKCRSEAEYETLKCLLPPDVWRVWQSKISARNPAAFFYCNWSYITRTNLSNDNIIFYFNRCGTPGPFRARLEVLELRSGRIFKWSNDDFSAVDSLTISNKNMNYPEAYSVELYLDDNLAYKNRYSCETEHPF